MLVKSGIAFFELSEAPQARSTRQKHLEFQSWDSENGFPRQGSYDTTHPACLQGSPAAPQGVLGVWGHGNSLQGPPGPANKLGAWCRSSPAGGTRFQNPNFEIPSVFALWSVPAALRKVQKKAMPEFTSILALWSVPAALRKVQKKAIPKKSGMYLDCLNMYGHFGAAQNSAWLK